MICLQNNIGIASGKRTYMLQEMITRMGNVSGVENVWYVSPDMETVEYSFREGIRIAYEIGTLEDYNADTKTLKLTNGAMLTFKAYYTTQLV